MKQRWASWSTTKKTWAVVGAMLVVLTIVGAAMGEPEEKETKADKKPEVAQRSVAPPQTTPTTTSAPAKPTTAPAPAPKVSPVVKPKQPRTSPAVPRPKPKTAKQKMQDALDDDAKIAYITDSEVSIEIKTPEGGFEGPSTGDLNREAKDAFEAIYKNGGYTRSSSIRFVGGLIDSRTGKDMPDSETGQFEMSKADAAEIDWHDEDVLYAIEWTYYRTFAHPALKQDD